MNAFEAAEANGRTAELQHELEALFDRQNVSPSKRRHVHPGNVPPGDGRGVRSP